MHTNIEVNITNIWVSIPHLRNNRHNYNYITGTPETSSVPSSVPFLSPSRGDLCPEFGDYHFHAWFYTFITYRVTLSDFNLL